MSDPYQSGAAAPPPERQREPIDPSLPQAALAAVRAVAKGNGIKPGNIALDGFGGEVLRFTAWLVLRIKCVTKDRRVQGRAAGEAFGSMADMRRRVQDIAAQAAASPDIIQHTASVLKARPDRGFGVKAPAIALKGLRRDLVVHEACQPCGAQGHTPCKNCQGQGRTYCGKCHGNRQIMCPGCHGTQMMMTAQGNVPCMRCQGRGRIGCDMCQQHGAVPCRICRGSGRAQCQNCGATGWFSHISSLEVRAEGRFEYDRASLPDGAAKLVDAMGPRLATGRHASVSLREDGVRYSVPDMAAEEFVVLYDVRLPWGKMRLRTGKAAMTARLFGFNARLMGLPPFLEKAAAPGLRALEAAANAPSQTAARMREALRYRIVSETVMGIVKQGQRKTYATLQARYPVGIRAQALQRTVRNADRALKMITKAPRLMGLGASLIAVALTYLLYFAGPVRGTIADAGTENAAMVLDLVLLLGGFYAVSAGIRYAGMRGLDRAVGNLLPPGRRSRLMPRKNGYYAWCGYAGVVLAYIVALAMARAGPSWLGALPF